MSDHRAKYKNTGLDSRELRRRREEEGIQLRKQKRDDLLSKRRTIDVEDNEMCNNDHDTGDNSPSNNDLSIGTVTQEMVNCLMQDENLGMLIENAQRIRKILSKEPHPPIEEVISSGLIPRFVKLLERYDCSILQFEVAWILTNIASGTTDQTQAVVDEGSVPKFIQLLGCDDLKVCEQAVWALGNIIGDGPKFREIVVESGFVPALFQLMTRKLDLGFLRNVVWVIVNLCRNKDPPPSIELVKQLVPALKDSIKMTDPHILSDTVWALSYITELGPDYGQILIDFGLVSELTPFMVNPDLKIQTATIRALGSLTTGSDEQTQAVVDAGALTYLYEILSNRKDRIIKEALWFLSNITAGSHEQIQEIINLKITPLIVHYLDKGDYAAQKEAAWAVYNMSISGQPKQIKELVDNNVIPPLCELLNIKDKSLIQLTLDTLMGILKSYGEDATEIAETIEACGGLDKIENLQQSDDNDIYNIAYKLIDMFFSENDGSEVDLSAEA